MKENRTNGECLELLRKRMLDLFWKIAEEREKIRIDGVPGYNEKAQFVGGKVINLCSYAALEFSSDEEEKKKMILALRDIITMCSGMKMETWGILNGLTGLYRLKTAGLYEEAVTPETNAVLKTAMDWHTFVDPEHDYALIHKPTNYYGVAFGIARFRELMGWDELGNSAILLDRLIRHISEYSGEYGFMDETQGDGRFDRYSILIPAEITELVLKTGWEEPQLIREMLGRSAHIVLSMANEEGWGFSYGRSIGAYGETAVLQILGAAAQLGGVLTKAEEELAFAYSLQAIRKMILFWYDEEMGSINMWDKGRRTDGYRNKNRILGENLSLSMQVIDVIEQWKSLGYDCGAEFETDVWKEEKEGLSFTRFAKNTYDRGLVICRNKGHVWSLPLICGGTPYFDKDAYLPVPRETGVLEAVPDVSHGALVPKLILEDGSQAMPICFFDSIAVEEGQVCRVVLKKLCRLGGIKPEPLEGVENETVYTFRDGEIEREDRFRILDDNLRVREIRLSFDTFSSEGQDEGHSVVFQSGPITSFETDGYETCMIQELDQKDGERNREPVETIDLSQAGKGAYGTPKDSFDTPHGPNRTQVCWNRAWRGEKEISVSWKLRY